MRRTSFPESIDRSNTKHDAHRIRDIVKLLLKEATVEEMKNLEPVPNTANAEDIQKALAKYQDTSNAIQRRMKENLSNREKQVEEKSKERKRKVAEIGLSQDESNRSRKAEESNNKKKRKQTVKKTTVCAWQGRFYKVAIAEKEEADAVKTDAKREMSKEAKAKESRGVDGEKGNASFFSFMMPKKAESRITLNGNGSEG